MVILFHGVLFAFCVSLTGVIVMSGVLTVGALLDPEKRRRILARSLRENLRLALLTPMDELDLIYAQERAEALDISPDGTRLHAPERSHPLLPSAPAESVSLEPNQREHPGQRPRATIQHGIEYHDHPLVFPLHVETLSVYSQRHGLPYLRACVRDQTGRIVETFNPTEEELITDTSDVAVVVRAQQFCLDMTNRHQTVAELLHVLTR